MPEFSLFSWKVGLISTIKLAKSKLSNGEQSSYDETRIFRGPRIFTHVILRGIKHKEI